MKCLNSVYTCVHSGSQCKSTSLISSISMKTAKGVPSSIKVRTLVELKGKSFILIWHSNERVQIFSITHTKPDIKARFFNQKFGINDVKPDKQSQIF